MLSELARAKVNLDLHVLGKRADGYHTLLSYVTFPELADELTFVAADTLKLTVTGEFAALSGTTENNLVLRAARALNAFVSGQHGAHMTLVKNIPVGAGLGGGSADAAATLRGLNRLWGLGLGMDELVRIGVTLGADVPMCLYSSPLRAEGIGEELTLLEPAPHPRWFVLVYPQVKLDTASVFKVWQRDPNEEIPDGHVLPLKNDLQPAAIALCPAIQEVLDALKPYATGHVGPRMSGSGTSCFQLFYDEAEAQACAAQMAQRYPQWWVKLTEIAA